MKSVIGVRFADSIALLQPQTTGKQEERIRNANFRGFIEFQATARSPDWHHTSETLPQRRVLLLGHGLENKCAALCDPRRLQLPCGAPLRQYRAAAEALRLQPVQRGTGERDEAGLCELGGGDTRCKQSSKEGETVTSRSLRSKRGIVETRWYSSSASFARAACGSAARCAAAWRSPSTKPWTSATVELVAKRRVNCAPSGARRRSITTPSPAAGSGWRIARPLFMRSSKRAAALATAFSFSAAAAFLASIKSCLRFRSASCGKPAPAV